MEKKRNQKGFTLAELLIVVAIIAVLVAIAIPVFTSQLEKSRESTDLANVRSAYAEIVAGYLQDDNAASISVKVRQTKSNWQTNSDKSVAYIGTSIGSTEQISVPAKKSGNYKVTISNSGIVTVQ
ncbi:MAG: prepilin-type N-terminal cleavage/methylation domain-containing protein [Eubacterium sp.]|nr:prepilin-type N-terminal cleavage/methylation domain-containing protein [Eubacterium sp.]